VRQIEGKPLPVSDSEVTGECFLDDLVLFGPAGRMSKVWLMCETVKRFARLLDDAHAREILSLDTTLASYLRREIDSEDSLYRLAELADLQKQTTLSSEVLVIATVRHLLSAFVAFALREIVTLVAPDSPLPDGKDCEFQKHLVDPLKAKGIFTGFPQEYVENVQKNRETVRNSFSHGDWVKLAANVGSVDLNDALLATAKFVSELQSKLEENGFDWRTPTIVGTEKILSEGRPFRDSSQGIAGDSNSSCSNF
jgi:hypothetical protein